MKLAGRASDERQSVPDDAPSVRKVLLFFAAVLLLAVVLNLAIPYLVSAMIPFDISD